MPVFNAGSPFAGTALVRKMRSPQTTGLECPNPGTADFHRTFLPPSFHSVTGVPVPMPLAAGPRNCGQLLSAAKAAAAQKSRTIGRHCSIDRIVTTRAGEVNGVPDKDVRYSACRAL